MDKKMESKWNLGFKRALNYKEYVVREPKKWPISRRGLGFRDKEARANPKTLNLKPENPKRSDSFC